ncbi:TadA family conjugal transfer-associated ATPase [Galbitalea soli]|uniref:TadA family conjugal transfer-associated ATPase n=1 Tax=Galbitalea soli TaxID=1268042 RepID=UPI00181E4CD0|nr:pilus assembly protein CpaF [Galbitalea soli]
MHPISPPRDDGAADAVGFTPRPRSQASAQHTAPFVASPRRPPDDNRGTEPYPPADPTEVDHYAADLGFLSFLARDRAVTDVFVNGPSGVWVDRGSGPRQIVGLAPPESEVRALAVRLIARGGRHVDEASPCVDARLGGGVRVHAVLPPISRGGTLLSLRFPPGQPPTLDALDDGVFFSAVERDRVAALVTARANILLTGAAGSGKTTLLAALLGQAPPNERIIAVEDVAELRVRHPHFLALESRQANLEGAGGIGLDRLVREALRMRPDRLVLGECRGAEVRELLGALNTGHDGGAGTLHANSLRDVPARLESLGALAGLGAEAIARQARSAIGAVIHLERVGARRRIAAVGALGIDSHDRLSVEPLP